MPQRPLSTAPLTYRQTGSERRKCIGRLEVCLLCRSMRVPRLLACFPFADSHSSILLMRLKAPGERSAIGNARNKPMSQRQDGSSAACGVVVGFAGLSDSTAAWDAPFLLMSIFLCEGARTRTRKRLLEEGGQTGGRIGNRLLQSLHTTVSKEECSAGANM